MLACETNVFTNLKHTVKYLPSPNYFSTLDGNLAAFPFTLSHRSEAPQAQGDGIK